MKIPSWLIGGILGVIYFAITWYLTIVVNIFNVKEWHDLTFLLFHPETIFLQPITNITSVNFTLLLTCLIDFLIGALLGAIINNIYRAQKNKIN